MSAKKNAGRKRGGKKHPETLDDALYGDYQGEQTDPENKKEAAKNQAIFLVHQTRLLMSRIPDLPDPQEEQDRFVWHAFVGCQLVQAIQSGDEAAVVLFEGIARILKDKRVSDEGDWKPVDDVRTEAAVIAMRQRATDPEWHLPGMTEAQLIKRLAAATPKAGDKRRTAGRIARQMGVKIVPGQKGRPKNDADGSTE